MTRFLHIATACAMCAALLALLFTTKSFALTRNGFVLDNATIPAEQIVHGGPEKDGIPSLDQPAFINPDQADFLQPGDRVLGVVIEGATRAYPIKILNYHEIVNDSIDGKPVVITFCPLCGSGMVFSATVGDTPLVFGVSGLLYNSDMLLYDRHSNSLWSQMGKVAISGRMKGARLEAIPVSHTTWGDWQARHPNTRVLSMDTGFRRNYLADPYPGYGRDGGLYFPVTTENREYERKSLVMGLEIDGHFKAYPFAELKRGPAVFTDIFRGKHISIQYDHKNQAARILDARGETMPTVIAFWFAWHAFHPDTVIYRATPQ